MKLTHDELNEMVDTMGELDNGSFELTAPDDYESDEDSLGELSTNDSIEIEIEDEDDGQPTEYDEWQDLYGGDDSIYEHDCDCMFDN